MPVPLPSGSIQYVPLNTSPEPRWDWQSLRITELEGGVPVIAGVGITVAVFVVVGIAVKVNVGNGV